MSVTTDRTQDAPSDALDFDAAAERLFAQTDAPQDAPAAGQPTAAPAEATPVAAVAPAEETDDDSEDLPIDQRFARAQRREAKVRQEAEARAARLTELEQAHQHAQSQINGYKGRMKQLEGERDRFKAEATDQNAALNRIWEDGIAATDDPATKADLQRRYDIDRREREIAQKEKEIAFVAQQREEETTRLKETQTETAIEGMRRHAMPEAAQEVLDYAARAGLPATEIADIRTHFLSPTVGMLIQRMHPLELHQYRENLLAGARAEVDQRLPAYRAKQAAGTREELRTVYRAEPPLNQGGGPVPEDLSRFYGTNDTLGMLNAMSPPGTGE